MCDAASGDAWGYRARRALVLALAAAALLALASLAPTSAKAGLPPLEPVRSHVIPLPDGIVGASFPFFSPNGKHVITGFLREGEENEQVAIVRTDGRRFRCLTCGLPGDLPATKPRIFEDGKRILVQLNNTPRRSDAGASPISGPTSDFQYAILECEPSIYRCRERRSLPLELPLDRLIPNGAQNREPEPSPDGKRLLWTEVRAFDGPRMTIGELVREPDAYRIRDARVVNPPVDPARATLGDLRMSGGLPEAKVWADGGRALLFATHHSALNYDTWRMNLASGEFRRLTRDLDWDEGLRESPDGRWYVQMKAKGFDVAHVLTQIERPSLFDFSAFAQLGQVIIRSARRCLLEPWLVGRRGERGRYSGQPIFDARDVWDFDDKVQWHPDGTKLVGAEVSDPGRARPGTPESRLVIIDLPARRPSSAPRRARSITPRWASRSDEYDGPAAEQVIGRRIPGPAGGSLQFESRGFFGGGGWSVGYDRYSEDGRSFLSGTESITVPNPVLGSVYSVDLELEGEDTGRMEGTLLIERGRLAGGGITSTLNGRTISGLPGASACPRPRTTRLRARPMKSARRDRAVRLRIRVTGKVLGENRYRPVRHARVRAEGIGGPSARAFTDRRGIVELTVPSGERVPITARAAGIGRDSFRF